jgi:MFS family permease
MFGPFASHPKSNAGPRAGARLWHTAVTALADALTDPRRANRTAAAVITGYVLVWTLYAVIAKSSQDVHFDMGEAVAWSRELAVGNPKHPPASAWLVGAWFLAFPLADWAYYLLAVLTAAVGLWIAWMLSGRWLAPEKRAAGLALLTLVPFFNFQALKFNANTVLIPLWAATMWCFLRAFETRSAAWAAAAGLAAAGAMLGKYWSIVLVAGLAVAALVDPRRRRYFRSAAPWVTIAVGAAAIAPHLAWLVAHGFGPIRYAASEHAAASTLALIKADLGFLAGTAGYVAVPAALAWIAARPDRQALADTLWPATADRRLPLVAFAAPLLVSTILALAAGAEIVSLWAMPAVTLLPVVLLSSPLVVLPRPALVRLLALAVAFPLLAVLASPAVALLIHRAGPGLHAAHYRLLARAIDESWRRTSDRPLRLVGSGTNLVNGVAFYLADRPSTDDIIGPAQTPWADAGRVTRDGIALVCAAGDAPCIAAADAIAAGGPQGHRTEVEIARFWLGIKGQSERYLIVTVPPGPAQR